MQLLIANTFTDSLARLTGQEQKAVKTTAFDMQLNPAHPSLKFHRIEQSKDPDFWSVRVNADIRIIVHRTNDSLLLCYVAHHDAAYVWAQRRKIERHPTTGAAQIVEVREVIHEAVSYAPPPMPPAPAKPPLFAGTSTATLLKHGVPPAWLDAVQHATEDSLLELAAHLPQEAAETLLELATGAAPLLGTTVVQGGDLPMTAPPAPQPVDTAAYAHPDALRRFRVIQNQAELERALDYPWEQWTVFLHPAQRNLVERDYNGPARIAGSAGTGKTVVALHRAVLLARRHPTARVVLLTFADALANALQQKIERLVGNEPAIRARIRTYTTRAFARDLYTQAFGAPTLATPDTIRGLLAQAARSSDSPFSEQFLFTEWNEVVDAWQVNSWETYRDVPRLGRKTRTGGRQREALWAIFAQVQHALRQQHALTWAGLLHHLTAHLTAQGTRPFDFAIVDEAQDLTVAELRFLAVFGNHRPDSLFFTGDLGQRIFQQPFSWKALGVDIRGRSHTLTINYRTSHQIRQHADRLLPTRIADVDGNVEERHGTISIFNGPPPRIVTCATPDAEIAAVADWVRERLAAGLEPHEIGVFVRARPQLARAFAAVERAGSHSTELDEQVTAEPQHIAVSTMHLAKGLEFRAVAVMACDDAVIPLQERIERVSDESDLEDAYNTERHLLYVACTRARDHLLVSGVEPASEFLDDMLPG